MEKIVANDSQLDAEELSEKSLDELLEMAAKCYYEHQQLFPPQYGNSVKKSEAKKELQASLRRVSRDGTVDYLLKLNGVTDTALVEAIAKKWYEKWGEPLGRDEE